MKDAIITILLKPTRMHLNTQFNIQLVSVEWIQLYLTPVTWVAKVSENSFQNVMKIKSCGQYLCETIIVTRKCNAGSYTFLWTKLTFLLTASSISITYHLSLSISIIILSLLSLSSSITYHLSFLYLSSIYLSL